MKNGSLDVHPAFPDALLPCARTLNSKVKVRCFQLPVQLKTELMKASLQGEYQLRLYEELMRNYNLLDRTVQNDSHSLSVSFSFNLQHSDD
ncbi:neuronal acetylcholine receptor subunit alpha-7 [Betta splendens]|uniref:Neuronal acetylcholine receptor subunit alpha-7 n=1 Tax=Betta splendens TaxID=158456 RepID=A0A9W2XVP5_BETSP|nr:neuronal acetylcholine receptor subunit alpha-7 [Betta splendens]